MTLDEAIKHCEEQITMQRQNGCAECALEHKQLKDWLCELRDIKNATKGQPYIITKGGAE